MADCLFCKIVAGEITAEKVCETDTVVAFNDIAPQAPIHVLFVPRVHIESSHDLGPDDAGILADLFGAIAAYAEEAGEAAAGYRVVTNVNDNGGQSVHHLHFHLLAGRQMRWPPG